MVMFTRWLLRFFKTERNLLVRYERSRPHFLRYLALDALLSVFIVFAGFQIFDSNSFLAERLTHSGDVALSSSQLIAHVKRDGISAYWLGPVKGDEYTVNHEVEGIVDLMYLPEGTEPSNDKAFEFEVKTYESQKIWDAHTHPILATASTQTLILSKEVTIRINPTSMKGVIATYQDKPEILAIAYPKPQTLQSMMKDVKSLKLIK